MGFYNFPHTRNYDSDLGFLIKKYKQLVNQYESIVDKYDTLTDIYNIVQAKIATITRQQLKEWLDDGTLELIISAELNIQLAFNTTTELLATNRPLQPGSFVTTQGYNTMGDLGAAYFLLSDTVPTNNNQFYFKFQNSDLYALMVALPNMNAHQFGIFGNNTDVTAAFQNAINFVHAFGDNTLFVPQGTYGINATDQSYTPSMGGHLKDSGGIKIYSNMKITHDSGTIMQVLPTNHQQYNLYRLYNVNNVTISGGTINGDRNQHFGTYGGEWGYGIAITGSNNIHITNMSLQNCWGDGCNLQYIFDNPSAPTNQLLCSNIFFDSITFSNNLRTGCAVESGLHVVFTNCSFTNTNGAAPQCGLNFEPANDNSFIRNCIVDNCYFASNQGRNVSAYGANANRSISNITIKNSVFATCGDTNHYNIAFESNTSDIKFNSNTCSFPTSGAYIILISGNGHYYFNNNICVNTKWASNSVCDIHISNNDITYNTGIPNLLECAAVGFVFINSNIFHNVPAKAFVITVNTNGNLFFTNNICSSASAPAQLFDIDAAPNIFLFATNNILPTGCYITRATLNQHQYLSQGGIGSCYFQGTKPLKAGVGTIAYDNNSGRIYVYTGSTWRYVMTTAES